MLTSHHTAMSIYHILFKVCAGYTNATLLKMGRYCSTTMCHYWDMSVKYSILLSKLSDCPNTDTSLCYGNYPFLTVQGHFNNCHFAQLGCRYRFSSPAHLSDKYMHCNERGPLTPNPSVLVAKLSCCASLQTCHLHGT